MKRQSLSKPLTPTDCPGRRAHDEHPGPGGHTSYVIRPRRDGGESG